MSENENLPEPQTPHEASVADMAKRIAGHPFFKGMPRKEIYSLAENAMVVSYKPGDYIFKEGEPANRFYLVETGEVALETSKRDQEPTIIQRVGPGDVLGWSWLFPPYYWHFEARAVTDTRAIFMYGSRLRENCETDHDLGYEIMKRISSVVIERLQSTRRELLRRT